MKTKISPQNTHIDLKFPLLLVLYIAIVAIGVTLCFMFLQTATEYVIDGRLLTIENNGNGFLSFIGSVIALVGIILIVGHIASKNTDFLLVGIPIAVGAFFSVFGFGLLTIVIVSNFFPQQAFCETVQGADSEWGKVKNGFECSVFNEQTGEVNVATYRMKLQPDLSVDEKSVYKMHPVSTQPGL